MADPSQDPRLSSSPATRRQHARTLEQMLESPGGQGGVEGHLVAFDVLREIGALPTEKAEAELDKEGIVRRLIRHLSNVP